MHQDETPDPELLREVVGLMCEMEEDRLLDVLPLWPYPVLDVIRRAVAVERSCMFGAAESHASYDRRDELLSVLATAITNPGGIGSPDRGREAGAGLFTPAVEAYIDRVRLLSRLYRLVDALCRAVEASLSVRPSLV